MRKAGEKWPRVKGLISKQTKKVNPGEGNSPAAPAGIRTRALTHKLSRPKEAVAVHAVHNTAVSSLPPGPPVARHDVFSDNVFLN